ncbi:MAG: flagellar assembly peptidoglycan hydrolase FlgJ [Gammaproteobacteria bacterium]
MTTSPTAPIAPNAVDLTGLEQLRRSAARDDKTAVAEVAVQFEALFIGMMLDSARKANLGDGLFDGQQTQQYLELMDQQVALDMARHGGLGFGKMLLQQLTPGAQLQPSAGQPPPGTGAAAAVPTAPSADAPSSTDVPAAAQTTAKFPGPLPASMTALGGAATDDISTSPAEDFVAQLLPHATAAAAELGVEPRLLLAQAALETGWGAAVPQHVNGMSAHNMFGIKAGSGWGGVHVAQMTLEHENGVAVRRRDEFRAYSSSAASFADYADLIGNTPRYANALANADNPEAYAHAVQAAGYATDPSYAAKWLAIYHGERLDGAMRRAGLAVPTAMSAAIDLSSDLGQ